MILESGPESAEDNGVVHSRAARRARANVGRNRVLAKTPTNCNDAWMTWIASNGEAYPSIQGKSRWHAFPGLRQVDRPYTKKAWEKRHWSLDLVLAHMSQYSAVRHVDRKGRVSVYNRHYYVGTAHQGKDIYVLFDPLDREWVFTTAAGVELRRKTACRDHPRPDQKTTSN